MSTTYGAFRVNGIGTSFLGFSETDIEGNCTATYWLTLLYLPILPLYKAKINRKITSQREFIYILISKKPIVLKEILLTYLFGWILVPVLILAPLLLCITEVADMLGIPESKFHGLLNKNSSVGIREIIFIGTLIWIIIATSKLKSWADKKGLQKKR